MHEASSQKVMSQVSCGRWNPVAPKELFKIGVVLTVSVRRVKFAMASGYPYKATFAAAYRALYTATDTS
jgi:hypothetical protein